MKKIKFLLWISLSLISVVSFSTSIAFSKSQTSIRKIKNENDKLIEVNVKGAILFPKTYYFEQPITYNELFSIVKLKNDANIAEFNIFSLIKQSTKIFIPSRNKIQWKNLNNIDQLISRNIKTSIAKKIIELRKKKDKIIWKDIEKISGIGKVTLNLLQKIINI
ncbi:MAG0490 family ComEA-like DNA-binding protein [Mycoplasmopsis lipofaciens]|uniref:MAG0490 family ComEA-like DNA-binding protein n=1 Tax=Mycoplasmopsis lipofaciens TaxID=114884 RepID=UPI0004888F7C|nr:hypothetical protein [Mycoplasmopsis lipofaciens]